MTNPKYRPTTAHDALCRISEECHELGKVACKGLRFGIYDRHPKKQKLNIDLLLEELADVNEAVNDFLRLNNDGAYPPVSKVQGNE